jgi:hypothetical protein
MHRDIEVLQELREQLLKRRPRMMMALQGVANHIAVSPLSDGAFVLSAHCSFGRVTKTFNIANTTIRQRYGPVLKKNACRFTDDFIEEVRKWQAKQR